MKEKIIIYQVFTRLFGNENVHPVPNGTLAENGSGKMEDFTDRALLAIRNLGVTHIWYTGLLAHATRTDYSKEGLTRNNPHVVKGIAGSPYAVQDYYDIDPDLAVSVRDRMAEFEALVDRTHAAGLRMIIDFVPNHVAREYRSLQRPLGTKDLGEGDDTSVHFSPQNNFYYIPKQPFCGTFDLGSGSDRYEEFPAKATGNDCFGAYPGPCDWYETVKLNYGVDYLHDREKYFDPIPDTWIRMRDILLFWAQKGIDGFRCDMVEMVPVEFWGWVIPQIKAVSPALIFIAEVYNPREYREYIYRGAFDYLYDKVGLYDLLRNITCGHTSTEHITKAWQSVDDIAPHMLNFLENHDEQRIASDFFAGDPFKGIPALVVSALMNTNPFMIYFGQELGERGMDHEGFSGVDGRTTIFDYWSLATIRAWMDHGRFWSRRLSSDQKRLRHLYQRILTACNREAAVREGAFFDLMYVNTEQPHFNSYKQYAFLRKYGNELLLIVANFDAYPADTEIRIPAHAFDVLDIAPSDTPIVFQELLSKECTTQRLLPDAFFHTRIGAYGAVVWKCRLLSKKTILK